MFQTLKGSRDFQGVICQPQQTSLWKKIPELIYTHTVIALKYMTIFTSNLKEGGRKKGGGRGRLLTRTVFFDDGVERRNSYELHVKAVTSNWSVCYRTYKSTQPPLPIQQQTTKQKPTKIHSFMSQDSLLPANISPKPIKKLLEAVARKEMLERNGFCKWTLAPGGQYRRFQGTSISSMIYSVLECERSYLICFMELT